MTVSSKPPAVDVVVSYDCLPKIGGAHMWLYEVYRRWPAPVAFFTSENSVDASMAAREREFDAAAHGALSIQRRARPIGHLSLVSPDCLRSYASHVRSIARLAHGGPVRLHALRAFPEGFAALLYQWSHPRSAELIVYAHGEEILISRMSRQLRWMTERVYRAADLVIVNSESTRRLVLETAPQARVACIHPGVDVGAFRQPPTEVAAYREKLGWSADTIVVGSVARMEARKNQAALIRAVAKVRAEGFAVALVCGGDGPERASLVELTRTLQLESCVRFTGAVSDAEKKLIFAACDIHAMPSVQLGEMIEGFGIVFLEAAAAGKPSICGNIGGQAEAVLDGRTGLVVDGNDLERVADALRSLVRDRALRERLGREGLAWAREHDWSAVVAKTLRAIRAR